MPPSPISNAELDVLQVLWNEALWNGVAEEARAAAVRDVHERLSAGGKDWAYNTVQTLLNRLAEKGYLHAERAGRVVEYSVTRTREDVVRQQLDGIADKICGGSPAPLVQSLFEGRKFSTDEIQDFRRLLDELEARNVRIRPRRRATRRKGGR